MSVPQQHHQQAQQLEHTEMQQHLQQQASQIHHQQMHAVQSTAVVSSNGALQDQQHTMVIDGVRSSVVEGPHNGLEGTVIVGEAEPLGGDSEIIVATTSSSDLSQTELQNLQLTWPMRQWTNDLTFKLLEKIQARKSLLLDPKLRRRMVYSEVAEEFQKEGVAFTTSDIEKKYTSLLSTYRRNMDKKRGSTWQYFSILEDIYSEVGPDGLKVHLPTSTLNPSAVPAPPHNKTELRQSKRMRTRPARLTGYVDYPTDAASARFDTDFYSPDSFDRVRELMNERLDELQSQRDAAFHESKKAWTDVKEGLDKMNENIQTLNNSVVMLAHTVTSVLNGMNKFKKT